MPPKRYCLGGICVNIVLVSKSFSWLKKGEMQGSGGFLEGSGVLSPMTRQKYAN